MRASLVLTSVACTIGGLLVCALTGCGENHRPPPLEFAIHTPYSSVKTLAIAPAINLSGSRDFDPLVVSDTIFAEMQQVEELNVIPLNKTLIAMERLGIHSIDDPKVAHRNSPRRGRPMAWSSPR